MQRHGVRRLVNLSTWGSGGAAVPPSNLVVRFFLLPILLRHLLADKKRGEMHLFASGLDYTNVEQVMHREDLARFMVEQLASDQWLRKCVVIGY
jgi:hypothetical protein